MDADVTQPDEAPGAFSFDDDNADVGERRECVAAPRSSEQAEHSSHWQSRDSGVKGHKAVGGTPVCPVRRALGYIRQTIKEVLVGPMVRQVVERFFAGPVNEDFKLSILSLTGEEADQVPHKDNILPKLVLTFGMMFHRTDDGLVHVRFNAPKTRFYQVPPKLVEEVLLNPFHSLVVCLFCYSYTFAQHVDDRQPRLQRCRAR